MLYYSPKLPAQQRLYGMDFWRRLGVTTIVSVAVTSVSVLTGNDQNPTAILNGAAAITTGKVGNSMVTQPLKGGLPGVQYLVTYTITCSDGQVLAAQVVLGVVSVLP